jgi:hypothetical protein
MTDYAIVFFVALISKYQSHKANEKLFEFNYCGLHKTPQNDQPAVF